MRPAGWGPPDPDKRPAWEDGRLQVLLVVMLVALGVGLAMATPVPPWYCRSLRCCRALLRST
jgi:hypothetical protein